jgi:hypothetical protein
MEIDIGNSEKGESASNSYDYYLQFASAPLMPGQEDYRDASSNLKWKIDSELEG